MDQNEKKRNGLLYINTKDAGFCLLIVFLTLPHMKPPYLSIIPAVDLIFDVLRGTTFIVILFWYIFKRKRVSSIIVLTAIWRSFLVYSTFIHEGEIYSSIVISFSILSILLLYDAAYNSKKSVFVSAQLFCFELAIYINLLTEIIFPDGLYTDVSTIVHTKNWFLGYYNNHSQYYIPALMFAWLYHSRSKKILRPVLLTVAIYVSAFLVWSGGVLCSLVCMTFVFLFFMNRTKIMNYYTYWSGHIFFFMFIYIFQLQNLISWLVSDILGKLTSLLVRIDIWKYTLIQIRESPIIGYGIQSVYVRVKGLHTPHGVHAHNMLLELLYEGGAIGLALWVIIVLLAGRRLIRFCHTQESKVISTAFLGWCVATLVEPFTTPLLMGMFVIADRSNEGEAVSLDNADKESRRKRIRWRRAFRVQMR